MGTDVNLRKAYNFLLDKARDGTTFTARDLKDAVGWDISTARTYLSKQLQSVVTQSGRGRPYTVYAGFIHLSQAEFIQRVSQTERILPTYSRVHYSYVMAYEFLMPLTREDLLRSALDGLFYKDILDDKIGAIGLRNFYSVLPRKHGISNADYKTLITDTVSKYFGGYSITHVNGRFRANANILSQVDAVGARYVIDETTAIVRFLVPLSMSQSTHGEKFKQDNFEQVQQALLDQEIQLVRTLLLEIFAEVVVHSVQGEDEIWLLETVDGKHSLFKWEVR